MNVAKQIVKNMFSLSAAEFAGKGLAVIFTIYLIKTIGPANNGIFTSAKSLVQGFLIIVWLGFDQVGIREVARDRTKLNDYVGAILSIRLIIGVLSYAALLLMMEFYQTSNSPSLLHKYVTYVYGILILGNAFLINWAYQAVERMQIIAIRSVLVNSLNLFGLLVFVNDENDLLLAVWIIVISFLVNSIWMLAHFFKSYGIPRINFNKLIWKTIIWQSIKVGLVFLIVTFYSIIGVQMLSHWRGDIETGIYGAAFQIMVFLLIPTGILQGAFFPQISKLNEMGEKLQMISKYLTVNILVGIFLSFSLYFFSDFVVEILGDKYQGTNDVLKILSGTLLIQYLSTSYFSPLIAWKRENTVIFANLAGLLANVLMNFLLIPEYGYIGAAIATIFCEGAVLVVLWIIFNYEFKTIFLPDLLKIITFSIPGIILSFYLVSIGLHFSFSFIIGSLIIISFQFIFKIIKLSDVALITKK